MHSVVFGVRLPEKLSLGIKGVFLHPNWLSLSCSLTFSLLCVWAEFWGAWAHAPAVMLSLQGTL